MTDLRLLEREMYAEAEAARLLDVAPSTLHYWPEGKAGRAGKVHRPVIRQEPKGAGAAMTWAEFVEAGLLRQYRRELKVRLPELRVHRRTPGELQRPVSACGPTPLRQRSRTRYAGSGGR